MSNAPIVHTEVGKKDDWLFDLVRGENTATVTDSDGRQGYGTGGTEGEAIADAVKDLNSKR